MKAYQRIPFALSLLAASVAQTAVAAPTSGAYVSDKQNTWVQDRVGDRIGTVNMIMCIIGSMRGDAMVNQGPYVALIDEGKCQGRGDSSKSGSTNAGESNATNYMSAVVQSTQATTTDPLVIKAWLHSEEEHDGNPVKATIYAYVVATEGKSDAHPNGLFKMYFCGEPEGMSGTCMFKGSLQSTASGLSFYQEENGDGGPSTTRLMLQNNPSTESGMGKISGVEQSTPYDYKFAYDGNYFRRQEGSNPDVCFARDKSRGETSTWRYGTYQEDGSRLNIDNPGFSVKYTNGDDTYYGFWSFWGLWLPESAMSEIALGHGSLTRKNGGADEVIHPIQKGGKLWRLTRHTGTLDDFKNVPMMYWSNTAIGGGPAFMNYELQWDGSSLNAISYQNCSGGNGCTSQALSSPVALNAATLSGAYVKSLPIFFPSGGGSGSIDVPSVSFAAGTGVAYRTRDMVSPSASDIGLNCLTMCPTAGTTLSTALASNGSPFQDTPSWGPVSTAHSYTFHSGLVYSGALDAAHAVDASGVAQGSMGAYKGGLNSGNMVADADLSSIRCDSNGTPNASGTHYCPYLVDQAATLYQWETGPNQWNKFFGADGITIAPPKSLALTAAATFTNGSPDAGNNIRGRSAVELNKFNGNKVQLQFSGFGELQGIPGHCVNPDTNQVATSCSQATRWVPAFDMIDGAVVSDDSHNYYVKYLEREMRLGKVNCSEASSLSLSSAGGLSLPTSSLVDVNPKNAMGAEPTPSNTKPSVIDGIVQ